MCKLLTVEDVATRIQLHPATILGYIKNGAIVGKSRVKLKAAKFGRTFRVKTKDLDKFLEATQV